MIVDDNDDSNQGNDDVLPTADNQPEVGDQPVYNPEENHFDENEANPDVANTKLGN